VSGKTYELWYYLLITWSMIFPKTSDRFIFKAKLNEFYNKTIKRHTVLVIIDIENYRRSRKCHGYLRHLECLFNAFPYRSSLLEDTICVWPGTTACNIWFLLCLACILHFLAIYYHC
jgi:hypothetical protein